MALARTQAVFTYSSTTGGVTYYFDLVLDAQGIITVKNVRLSTGQSTCSIPDCVLKDIADAQAMVYQLVGESDADHGQLTFTGQTQQSAIIAAGVLNNTNYRVAYVTSDPIGVVTINKTTTGFTAVTSAAYGSPTDPKTVSYIVFVATHQNGTSGGEVVFTAADAGLKVVTFPTPFTTANYRVVLEPGGFFTARVINQTVQGFTIQLGYTLAAPDTATVGYDIFV